MTDLWSPQVAVYQRLVAALSGLGHGGADVPVYDHARPNPPRLFVRIDGWSITDRSPKNSARSAQEFYAHVFDTPQGDATGGRGMRDCKRVQAAVIDALHLWRPKAGGVIRHQESSIDTDDDGHTRHGISRFTIQLRG